MINGGVHYVNEYVKLHDAEFFIEKIYESNSFEEKRILFNSFIWNIKSIYELLVKKKINVKQLNVYKKNEKVFKFVQNFRNETIHDGELGFEYILDSGFLNGYKCLYISEGVGIDDLLIQGYDLLFCSHGVFKVLNKGKVSQKLEFFSSYPLEYNISLKNSLSIDSYFELANMVVSVYRELLYESKMISGFNEIGDNTFVSI